VPLIPNPQEGRSVEPQINHLGEGISVFGVITSNITVPAKSVAIVRENLITDDKASVQVRQIDDTILLQRTKTNVPDITVGRAVSRVYDSAELGEMMNEGKNKPQSKSDSREESDVEAEKICKHKYLTPADEVAESVDAKKNVLIADDYAQRASVAVRKVREKTDKELCYVHIGGNSDQGQISGESCSKEKSERKRRKER
jgi:hypothetical protein